MGVVYHRLRVLSRNFTELFLEIFRVVAWFFLHPIGGVLQAFIV
jgi:F0F1-type ATP synthase membrane subunit a